MPGWIAPVLAIVVIAIAVIATSVKVIPEYERGIVFRLGKLRPT